MNCGVGTIGSIPAGGINCKVTRNAVPPRPSLTGWSSRHQQAPLVGTLRTTCSGAAYRGR